MKIINAYDLTAEQIQADMPELLKAHEKACRNEPTWAFFGGIITLKNGHKYQVA
jgi:hypothetical protein